MFNRIAVDTEDGSYGVEFEKGLAIDLDGDEITLYPVDLIPDELEAIAVALMEAVRHT